MSEDKTNEKDPKEHGPVQALDKEVKEPEYLPRTQAILAVIDQLDVPEGQQGDIELLKALVKNETIDQYTLSIYKQS